MKFPFLPLLAMLAAALTASAASGTAGKDAAAGGGKMHVFLLTGQSNSLGAVKGSPASAELLQKYRSSALLWNGNMMRDTGVCFEKNPAWVPVAPQPPQYNGGLCMGPEYGFCHMLERRAPQQFKGKLGIIKASLDGGGNHFWQRNGKAYASIKNTVSQAMKQCRGGCIEGLLYLQGESDAGEEVTLAGKRFPELAVNLRKDAKAPQMKICMVGQPATWHGQDKTVDGTTTARELEAMVAANRKEMAWIRTRDLTKITRGDNMGVHYDGKSQITIGARYAYALLKKRDLPIPNVRNDNPDAALDAGNAAWWRTGEKARTTTPMLTVVWDVASANVEDRIEKDWQVGGLRVEDPFRAEIVIRGKAAIILGPKGIELQEADLKLDGVELRPSEPQVWSIAEGRCLTLQDVRLSPADAAKISLKGKGRLRLIGCGDAGTFKDNGGVSIEKQ